jgi:predicted RNA-binding Zn-ribbon protein involved in translation (DUF1610 family)
MIAAIWRDAPRGKSTSESQTPVRRPTMSKKRTAKFECMECGRKFYTVLSAERASVNGCPKCGGVDIDLPRSGSSVPNIERDEIQTVEDLYAWAGNLLQYQVMHNLGLV